MYIDRVIVSGNLGSIVVSVVVSTDLSGKEPHRQVDLDKVIANGSLDSIVVSVVVSTDLLDKEPHTEVEMNRVITSEILGGVMVNMQAPVGVGFKPALGTIFSHRQVDVSIGCLHQGP